MGGGTAERRIMKVHPKVIWDLIHEQAGTIGKAILEGAMNSVDAGATECHINIDRESFSIIDNGKGFADDDEIVNFFETFAYPHEEGDAKYGRYRMGRGQIMAFGVSKWHTNSYKMHVDFKPQQNNDANNYELGYDFYRTDDHYSGCKIEVDLYDKLAPSSLDTVLREIQECVKYIEIPIYLNGKVISINPKDEEWDYETEDAYIKRKSGGTLDVYNQGAMVSKMSQYYYGAAGVVVSKVPLSLNTARNQVKSTCPVFRRITKRLKDDNIEHLKKRAPLNNAQRDVLARNLFNREISVKKLNGARIVTDITNSHHPITVFEALRNYNHKVTIAERGDRVAEMTHTGRLAFVVTKEMAQRFNATTAEEFVRAVKDIYQRYHITYQQIVPVDVDEFKSVFSNIYMSIADKDLNKAERIVLRSLREVSSSMFHQGQRFDKLAGRQIFSKEELTSNRHRSVYIGESDVALAWTDGTSNIWFNRKVLSSVKDGYVGMAKLCNIMLHEYLHNSSSTDTHEHGVEFYNRFHDLSLHSQIIPACTELMMKQIISELRKDGKRLGGKLSSFEDMESFAGDAGMSSPKPKATTGAEPPSDRKKMASRKSTYEEERQIKMPF